MEIRNIIENESFKLFNSHQALALLFATRVGKSKIAINLHQSLQKKQIETPLRVLLIVAETAHKDNWLTEYTKWGSESLYHTLTVECYASLKKYEATNWDLIIFDEAHHLTSLVRLQIFNSMKSTKILFLSATMSNDLILSLQGILKSKIAIYSIGLKKAIELNLIPKPKVYLIKLTLDNFQKDQIITKEWGNADKRISITCNYENRWEYLNNKNKYPNISLNLKCTQVEKYNEITTEYLYWKKRYFSTRVETFKNKWLLAGLNRKRFLGEIKTNAGKFLIEKLKNKRFICFCATVEQAEKLHSLNSIHSYKKDSLQLIKDFNDKKINSLFAVGMTKEGQNFTDLDSCIILQLDGQELNFIQKFGRGLRAEEPLQFIFYYQNTKDEDYLNVALETIDKNYVIVIDDLINFEL
jgi:superfamily II DNA or RNA helicase